MAFTEAAIRKYIKTLVEEYGQLNTTEVITHLREALELDDVDRTPLQNRSDDRFSQIVRNVVSHLPADPIVDKYGFIVDKTQTPAMFYAKRNITDADDKPLDDKVLESVVLSREEIEARKTRKRKYIARRVDFDRIAEENSILGNAGEEHALDWERNRLLEAGVSANVLLDEVIHVSKKYGDGSGYDILSRNEVDGTPRYIEVKTTKGGADTPFYMSKNEHSFMEEFRDNAIIYRVYDFNYLTKTGEILQITQDDLEKYYYFDPITYKVMKK